MDASVRNRLVLWLASGLFFAALALAAASRWPARAPDDSADRAFARWLASSGALEDGPKLTGPPPSAPSGSPPGASAEAAKGDQPLSVSGERPDPGREDDEILFAARHAGGVSGEGGRLAIDARELFEALGRPGGRWGGISGKSGW